MSERHFWSVDAMRTALAKGEISAQELATLFLQRIETLDPHIQAYLTVTPEEAIAQAKAVDEKRARKEPLHPLAGIPIALKDNLCTRGIRTTAASKILYNFVPPYDATVVARLREIGMVFLGKTNLDEFAMGSSTENSGFQPTRNPWDLERVPGGSSGGSAAAVAAAEAPLALGSDTGGSIRQPAALCGIVGMKPSYGRVSRYGLIAYASSLDQIGPFAHDLADAALLLGAIAGRDPLDSTSVDVPVPDYLASLDTPPEGLRVGVPREFFGEGLDAEVEASIREAVTVYER